MCGIAGIFNRNHSPVDPKLLVCMTRTLVHRGPDEEGYFVNAGIAGRVEQTTAAHSAPCIFGNLNNRSNQPPPVELVV